MNYWNFLFTLCKKGEGYCDTFVLILDVKDNSSKNVDLGVTKENILSLLNYFPETLHKLYVINSDLFSRTIWNTVKFLLDKKTVDKVPYFNFFCINF